MNIYLDAKRFGPLSSAASTSCSTCLSIATGQLLRGRLFLFKCPVCFPPFAQRITGRESIRQSAVVPKTFSSYSTDTSQPAVAGKFIRLTEPTYFAVYTHTALHQPHKLWYTQYLTLQSLYQNAKTLKINPQKNLPCFSRMLNLFQTVTVKQCIIQA